MYRRNFYRSPWNDLNRLQREINELFSSTSPESHQVAPSYPALNLFTSDNEAILTAEIPGVNIKDIDIQVVGDKLSISGEILREPLKEGEKYHRRERGCGKFDRSMQLPFPVEINKIKASYEKGVLNIMLPRAEADKPKKIEIKTGPTK